MVLSLRLCASTSGDMVSIKILLAVRPKKKNSCTTSCLLLPITCGNIIVVCPYGLFKKKNAKRNDHLPSPPHILAEGCYQVRLSQVIRKTTGAEGRKELWNLQETWLHLQEGSTNLSSSESPRRAAASSICFLLKIGC